MTYHIELWKCSLQLCISALSRWASSMKYLTTDCVQICSNFSSLNYLLFFFFFLNDQILSNSEYFVTCISLLLLILFFSQCILLFKHLIYSKVLLFSFFAFLCFKKHFLIKTILKYFFNISQNVFLYFVTKKAVKFSYA